MNTRTVTPLRDKIFGKMVDGYGLKTTSGGLIVNEKDATTESIRPRWFEVTHVGPDNIDYVVGEYVLVFHGRWSRAFTISDADATKYFHLDLDQILLKSDTNPIKE